jgi:hypothetical protein
VAGRGYLGGMAQMTVVVARLNGQTYRCPTCAGEYFRTREVKLNTTTAELFGTAWANESATGMVCLRCGNVQLFVGGAIQVAQVQV